MNEPWEIFTDTQPERRADSRFSVDVDAILQIVGHGEPVPARIVDLSQEGCRVRTSERLSVRAPWSLIIGFKVNGVAFRFNSILEWTSGQNLLGIRFVNMNPSRMVELAQVICEMEAAAAKRAQAVNQLVAEQQAPDAAGQEVRVWVHDAPHDSSDTSAGQEYHIDAQRIEVQRIEAQHVDAQRRDPPVTHALELRAPSQPAASPAPPATASQAAQAVPPRDRRAQPRHGVDTSAVIFLVKIASTLRGRILDLSLGGCRIRTEERFPVGIYTRVETEFRLEGLPFRLGGVVQAIHNRHTVGIRFLDLSERKRRQVAELIGEIEEMRAAQLHSEPPPADHHI